MRQAGATAELEITPAMIAAGVTVFEQLSGCSADFVLVREVYVAMELVRSVPPSSSRRDTYADQSTHKLPC